MEEYLRDYFEDIGKYESGDNLFVEEKDKELIKDDVMCVYTQKAICKKCGEVITYYLRNGAWSVTFGNPERNLLEHKQNCPQSLLTR